MPYKDPKKRLQAAAECMRRRRLYVKAVGAGYPKALEAERCREPMRPVHEMTLRLRAMTADDRRVLKPEFERLLRECQAIDPEAARARYLQLKAEVIAEHDTSIFD